MGKASGHSVADPVDANTNCGTVGAEGKVVLCPMKTARSGIDATVIVPAYNEAGGAAVVKKIPGKTTSLACTVVGTGCRICQSRMVLADGVAGLGQDHVQGS